MNRQTRSGSISIGQEDGAVAIIAAVVIAFVAIILLAFSTDIGSLWQSQRALVTDTDAAALAGAIELAEDWMDTDVCSRDIAETEAVRVLGLNNQGNGEFSSQPIEGSPTADCRVVEGDAYIGEVQMTARQPSPGFVSRQDLSAAGTSTATFELLLGEAEGLAVCQNLFDGNMPKEDFEVTLNGTDYLLFPYKFAEKTLEGADGVGTCQVTPSNSGAPFTAGGWGFLTDSCDLGNEDRTWCDAQVGTAPLKDLGEFEGKRIDFPIFEKAEDVGSNAKYLIVGRVQAELVGACGKGNGSLTGGGFVPEDCKLPFGKVQAEPGFVVVKEPTVTYFTDSTATKFRDATYSICDVDGSGEYCP